MSNKVRELLTAADVARCCRVDLKTIHNWSARGELPSFRTPGRHLRFRRADVLDFVRKYGYPVPAWLTDGLPRVAILAPTPALDALREDPLPGFTLTLFSDPLLFLLQLGATAPDAAVLVPVPTPREVPLLAMVAALQVHPATRLVRLVSVGPASVSAVHLGAAAHLPTLERAALARTLGAVLGTQRSAE